MAHTVFRFLRSVAAEPFRLLAWLALRQVRGGVVAARGLTVVANWIEGG